MKPEAESGPEASATEPTRPTEPHVDSIIKSEPLSDPPPSSLVPEQSGSHEMSIDPTARPPSSPAPRRLLLPEDPDVIPTPPQSSQAEQGGISEDRDYSEGLDDPSKQVLTAIYRPESKAAWRKELAAAGEQALQAEEALASKQSSTSLLNSSTIEHLKPLSDEEQLASISLDTGVAEDDEKTENSKFEKVWTSRKNLRSHLDVVRTVAFATGVKSGVMLVTGGDDCTVKVWHVEAMSVLSLK